MSAFKYSAGKLYRSRFYGVFNKHSAFAVLNEGNAILCTTGKYLLRIMHGNDGNPIKLAEMSARLPGAHASMQCRLWPELLVVVLAVNS
ncbi:hypothetical protein [Noviherbaspirillum saxi]|nr:hypothetical protein [Noviherbaspirillum saxi]